jgi:hypothetical protein
MKEVEAAVVPMVVRPDLPPPQRVVLCGGVVVWWCGGVVRASLNERRTDSVWAGGRHSARSQDEKVTNLQALVATQAQFL